MLDPAFRYERELPPSEEGPSWDNVLGDRYHAAWAAAAGEATEVPRRSTGHRPAVLEVPRAGAATHVDRRSFPVRGRPRCSTRRGVGAERG